jgi:mannose-1-phosphate guanylyltransferase
MLSPTCAGADRPPLWVVVLAGGDGTRLAPLTRMLYGRPVPKQFATLVGDCSLLQQTLLRARALAPWGRILVVVNERHSDVARRQCDAVGRPRLVVQPENLGTAPGLLLALAHLRAAHATGRILVMPSDHFVRRPETFVGWLGDLTTADDGAGEGILLVGARPDGPQTDYGWIVPGAPLTSEPPPVHQVVRFVEKPHHDLACTLMRDGGVWNTFILLGDADAFWTAIARYLPHHVTRFADLARAVGSPGISAALRTTYRQLPPASLSVEVLERARRLRVAVAPPCGWSDWGTPDRVVESLQGTAALAALERRLRKPPTVEQRR